MVRVSERPELAFQRKQGLRVVPTQRLQRHNLVFLEIFRLEYNAPGTFSNTTDDAVAWVARGTG